jgi:hypothetical protein
MPDIHLKRFQGQNVDLFVESKSKYDNIIYFHFINKRVKDSKNFVITFCLEEIATILCILRKELCVWKRFRDEDIDVTFVWEDKDAQKLWIHAANYSKTLNIGQIEVLKLLIKHLLKEKVKFATSKKILNTDDHVESPPDGNKYLDSMIETINKIEGKVINQTDKAVLINFKDETEVWIPKSTIHSCFSTTSSSIQSFMIENWVLKKNNMESLISSDFSRN